MGGRLEAAHDDLGMQVTLILLLPQICFAAPGTSERFRASAGTARSRGRSGDEHAFAVRDALPSASRGAARCGFPSARPLPCD
jgi:hypothetical protein